jgi:hypothetical protein
VNGAPKAYRTAKRAVSGCQKARTPPSRTRREPYPAQGGLQELASGACGSYAWEKRCSRGGNGRAQGLFRSTARTNADRRFFNTDKCARFTVWEGDG